MVNNEEYTVHMYLQISSSHQFKDLVSELYIIMYLDFQNIRIFFSDYQKLGNQWIKKKFLHKGQDFEI